MQKKAGARYLDYFVPFEVQKKSKTRFGSIVASSSALIAIIGTILISVLLAYTSTGNKTPLSSASAWGVCGVIGQNMDGRGDWKASWGVALPDANNRRFTLDEIASSATWWSHFSGTSSSDGNFLTDKWDDAIKDKNKDRPDNEKLPTTSELNAPELEGYRNFPNCVIGEIPGFVGSLGLNFGNFITKFTSFVTSMTFNSSFICPADGPPAGSGCVDLIKIIGGRGNDSNEGGTGQGNNSGIIGNLTSGIYFPLMLLVVLATGVQVAWTGLVKRRFREALFQSFWLAGSVVIGVMLLLNPSMLVKGPMVLGNTIVGCVVGAFNGGGCIGDSSVSSSETKTNTNANDNVCVSTATGLTPAQQTTLYVNSMTCSLWSAFVLQPYAQGAFGVSLDQLDLDSVIDAKTNQTVRSLLSSDGWSPPGTDFTPESICVNLQTTSSYNKMGKTFTGGSSTSSGSAGAVCNLAVFDLFMKIDATGGGITTAKYNPDNKWMSFMTRLPANDTLFKSYVDDSGGWGKMGMGILAAISSLLGSALIIVVSVIALVYYVIAIIMVALAPIFFLFGMNPGRGRKMMLGWLEQIVSNILKYVISAVFLLIAITFYGAILGSSDNLFSSLLFVVVTTIALFMYRKEVISILGRADMGGEKMSDSAEKFLNKAGNKTRGMGRTGGAVLVGGAVGGIVGAGVVQSMKSAAGRELRRGGGAVSKGLQAADASKINKDKQKNQILDDSQKQVTNKLNDIGDHRKEMLDAREKVKDSEDLLDAAITDGMNEKKVEVSIRTEFAKESHGDKVSEDYFDVKSNEAAVRNLELMTAKAIVDGDTNKATMLSRRSVVAKKKLSTSQDEFVKNHSDKDRSRVENKYANIVDDMVSQSNIKDDVKDSFAAELKNQVTAQNKRDSISDVVKELMDKKNVSLNNLSEKESVYSEKRQEIVEKMNETSQLIIDNTKKLNKEVSNISGGKNSNVHNPEFDRNVNASIDDFNKEEEKYEQIYGKSFGNKISKTPESKKNK